jgi:hypothetical protein
MSRPQATVRRVGQRPTANPKSEMKVGSAQRNSEFLIPNSELKRTPSAGRWGAEGVEWSPSRCPETENRGFAV